MAKPTKPDIKELLKAYVLELQGKQFIQYPGLLAEAHEQGIKGITTELVSISDDLVVFRAIAHMPNGDFYGYGDVTKDTVTGKFNVSNNILPHRLRMAETRAKARALRDATNIGIAAVEEMSFENAIDESIPTTQETSQESTQHDHAALIKENAHLVQEIARKKPGQSTNDIRNAAFAHVGVTRPLSITDDQLEEVRVWLTEELAKLG